MYIHHVAIWTEKLEEMRKFYVDLFQGKANALYLNPRTGFESYFISFASGANLELMRIAGMQERIESPHQAFVGLAHIAISVGSHDKVDELTDLLQSCDYEVISQPHMTGDGFYESCVLDPDGNKVEITE